MGLLSFFLISCACLGINSVHSLFNSFPVGFVPLVIAKDVFSTTVGYSSFADGSLGVPYIVAKGSTLTPVPSLPTLSSWALIGLGVLLAGISMVVLKK